LHFSRQFRLDRGSIPAELPGFALRINHSSEVSRYRNGMERFSALALGLLRDQRGATAIEYGFIALLVSTAAIAGLKLIGPAVQGIFTSIAPWLL
jgi:Flp pilus assembly pilin Flp